METFRKIAGFVCLFLMIGLIHSCKEKVEVESEKPLARVHDQKLYPSDIIELFGPDIIESDTGSIVDSYVRTWVRNKVLEKMAEKNITFDNGIEKMVNNYRSSLIRSKYEEALLIKHLDTTITEAILNEFYERHKSQFPLSEDMIRVFFIKVTRSGPKVEELKRWVKLQKSTDTTKLKNYAASYAVDKSFGDQWMTFEEMAAKLPNGALKERYLKSSKKDYYASDKDHRYFFNIMEYREKGSPSPIEFIKKDLSKVVLKKKKMETLNSISEQLFQAELEKNNVEIY